MPSSHHIELLWLMDNTEWSWTECLDFYDNAPSDLFDEFVIRTGARAKAQSEGRKTQDAVARLRNMQK